MTLNTETTLVNPLKPLAEKYVQLYCMATGKKLSPAEQSAMIESVSQFYSRPERQGRLEALVSTMS